MRLVLLAVISLVLNACVSPQIPITEQSKLKADALTAHNSTLKSWFIVSQVALLVDESSYFFTSRWMQDDERYHLRFEVGLAQGAIELKGQPQRAVLTLANQKQYKSSDPEQLIEKVAGYKIPVIGLKSWVRGIAHLNSQAEVSIQANGDTKKIIQDGWDIEYKKWETVSIRDERFRLPSDIRLNHGKVNIRFRPSQWQKDEEQKSNPVFSDLNSI
ncbi:MAG: outer membrane lipoprotein LolB [Gammaproteobacteria bacterium]|nr:outer membrane lipoprotein LolB [Gammaproteobacteria bacterium]